MFPIHVHCMGQPKTSYRNKIMHCHWHRNASINDFHHQNGNVIWSHWPILDFNESLMKVIFRHFLVIEGWGISGEIALRWTLLDLTDVKSTLLPVMGWCIQTVSHYLSQCWPSLPYGITTPQWVDSVLQHQKLLSFLQYESSQWRTFCQHIIFISMRHIHKF